MFYVTFPAGATIIQQNSQPMHMVICRLTLAVACALCCVGPMFDRAAHVLRDVPCWATIVQQNSQLMVICSLTIVVACALCCL
jgi:hypothetical protein